MATEQRYFFKYDPEGSLSPVDKIGVGLVEVGKTYEVSKEQAEILRGDDNFKKASSSSKAIRLFPEAPEPPSDEEIAEAAAEAAEQAQTEGPVPADDAPAAEQPKGASK